MDSQMIRLLALILSLLLIQGCSVFHAEPFGGRVVDAETEEPLEGVIIVAQWRISRRLVGDEASLLNIVEEVTDLGGDYHFDGWGPRPIHLFAKFTGSDPRVVYFKPGYWPEYRHNEVLPPEYRQVPLGRFRHDGDTIRMRRWDGGAPKRYYGSVSMVATEMTVGWEGDWKSFPRMAYTIHKVGEEVRRVYRSSGVRITPPHIGGFNPKRLSDGDKEYLRRVFQ